MASDMDEILKEEIKEYKETLTCPSCKVNKFSQLGLILVIPNLFFFVIQVGSFFLSNYFNIVLQVKRKDAILTKCFHAFCYDCLRTRSVIVIFF